jgi:hypothetical protein
VASRARCNARPSFDLRQSRGSPSRSAQYHCHARITLGLPRSAMSQSSSRETRSPESETTSKKHFRVQSGTTVRIRNRCRPRADRIGSRETSTHSRAALLRSVRACPKPPCARIAAAQTAAPRDRADRPACWFTIQPSRRNSICSPRQPKRRRSPQCEQGI